MPPGPSDVARTFHPTPELPRHLATLYERFPFERSILEDPISEIRPLAIDARHGEVAAIYGATLAIGNTTAIRGAIRQLSGRVGGDLAAAVESLSRAERTVAWKGFYHRWIRGDQMVHLAERLRVIYASYPSLESVFLEGMGEEGFAGGLDALARALRGGRGAARAPRGYAILFPSPLDAHHSPAKRLTLYARWMVRDRYPDLGQWRHVPTGELRIPLDQHVYWIAYHLGLTQRRTRSWATVEEVTEALRRIDPIDPIRFDFVLCHTGISGDCPKHRDLSICGPCAVRPDCRLWSRTRSAS